MKKYCVTIIALVLCSNVVDAKYYSQPNSAQDKYLNEEVFKGKRNGVFIDVGAHDGVTYSNTCFFERELGWDGICIEPIPAIFQKLEKNRNCVCIQGGIADSNSKEKFLCVTSFDEAEYTEMLSGLLNTYDPRHIKRIEAEIEKFGGKKEIIEIECYRLSYILEHHNIKHVDYLSIDVEGSEMKVLNSIDFSKVHIDVITIENNYGTKDIENFLNARGYKRIKKLSGDEVYRKTR